MDVLYGQKSTFPQAKNDWVLIDAKDQVLGRLASKVVTRLLGKHKVDYRPGVLMGDRVVIINAEQAKITGNKIDQKEYIWHSGHIGGLKRRKMKDQMAMAPEKIMLEAIKGMLPKTKLGKKLLTHVRVFAGAEHDLKAQKPETIQL